MSSRKVLGLDGETFRYEKSHSNLGIRSKIRGDQFDGILWEKIGVCDWDKLSLIWDEELKGLMDFLVLNLGVSMECQNWIKKLKK